MDLNKTIQNLQRFESKSKREGYLRDSTDFAFRKYLLILLREIVELKGGSFEDNYSTVEYDDEPDEKT